ncbi:hypothetical protein ABIB85_005102 [Bradyrhizobium sp. JR1.5]
MRRRFPSPLAGEGGSTRSGETGEGSLSTREPLAFESAEATPHPALRATFSRKGRTEETALLHKIGNDGRGLEAGAGEDRDRGLVRLDGTGDG